MVLYKNDLISSIRSQIIQSLKSVSWEETINVSPESTAISPAYTFFTIRSVSDVEKWFQKCFIKFYFDEYNAAQQDTIFQSTVCAPFCPVILSKWLVGLATESTRLSVFRVEDRQIVRINIY